MSELIPLRHPDNDSVVLFTPGQAKVRRRHGWTDPPPEPDAIGLPDPLTDKE